MRNAIAAAIAVIVIAFGAFGAAAQERDNVPTVDVFSPDFTYWAEPCTFTVQHLRNMRAYKFEGRTISDSVRLRDGKYEKKDEDGYLGADLAWVRLPRSSEAKPDIAIVLYDWEWAGGSSSQSDVVQVFGCKHNRLAVLQQISNDAHSEHAGINYDQRAGILTVKSVRYGAGAHCCPEKLDVVTFRWSGTAFKQIGWKTVPMPKTGTD